MIEKHLTQMSPVAQMQALKLQTDETQHDRRQRILDMLTQDPDPAFRNLGQLLSSMSEDEAAEMAKFARSRLEGELA